MMSPFLSLRSRLLQTLILALVGLTFYTYHKSTDGELFRQYAYVRNNPRPATSPLVYQPVHILTNTTSEVQSTPLTKNLTSLEPANSNVSHNLGSSNVNPNTNLSVIITMQSSSSSQVSSSTNALIYPKFMNSSSSTSTTKTTTTSSTPAPTTQVPINKNSARAIYNSGHTVSIPEKCPDFGSNMDLMVIISSAPTHFEARTAIRQTWAHYGQRRDIGIAFIIGATTDPKFERNLQKEQDMYGDIIRGRFIDSYVNLTLKTISMLEWVDTYCSEVRYVLKTDDDMFINIPRLVSFIYKHRKEKNVIYGKVAKKWKPVRNKSSKYFLSLAQYKLPFFPDFTTGPAYLISNDIVHNLYEGALNETFIKLEDVFVTGITAFKLGIRRIHANEFLNKRISHSPCNVQRSISIHMVSYSEQFDLWKKLLDGKTKCK